MIMEHINISVVDIRKMLDFIKIAFPEFVERGRGFLASGGEWVHIGTDEHYIALEQAVSSDVMHCPHQGKPGVNHIAWVVDDLAALTARFAKHDYYEVFPGEESQFRIRKYFADPQGLQWEFIQYLTIDNALRHQYSD